MNSEILAASSPERDELLTADILSDSVSFNRRRPGQRNRRRIVLTGIPAALEVANRFYQQRNYLEAFDIYEQVAAAYPEHSIEILAELYDLYQALPDREDRYSLYQARLLDFSIRAGDRVLDVGSGNVPFPFATHLTDLAPHDDHYGRAGAPFKCVQGKPVQVCDIENMDCFADKEFDFVYCSHVLEHVHEPERACRELMRIGKRGYIETPTRGKDLWLNTAQISNHRWSVEWLHSKLIFTEYTPEELEGLQCDLLMGMHLKPESKREKALTSLMYLKADLVNTMLLWEHEFDYEVRRRSSVGVPGNAELTRGAANLQPAQNPCLHQLKIYADRRYLAAGAQHTPLLIPLWGDTDDESNPDRSRFRRYSLVGMDYFVQTDLSQADLAVLPGDWTHCQSQGHEFAQIIQGSGKPMVIFFFNDSEEAVPIENSAVFRTSLRRSRRGPKEFAVPAWSLDFGEHYFQAQIPIRQKQSRPIVGFCGLVPPEETNLRKRSINALSNSNLIKTEFLVRTAFWAGALGTTNEAMRNVRREYASNIAASDYALCIRGAGNFSYRFYEVLSSGRIPVFVDTDCVLPYEDFIDWKKYCVWVDVGELDSIDEKIAVFHEKLTPADFVDLQHACRDLWVRWLSPEGFFANFYRHFIELPRHSDLEQPAIRSSWTGRKPVVTASVCSSASELFGAQDRPTLLLKPNSRNLVGAQAAAVVSASRSLPLEAQQSEIDFCHAIEKIVQPGWTCADVGANVGSITAVLAECVGPTGKVLAFEAHPANAKVLRENMKSRGYASRVRVGNVAISDGAQSKVWLHAGRNASACEWNIVGHDVDGRSTRAELEVIAAKLDTFFPKGSRLDLAKIDIEGAAGSALAGMSRLLRETRPILLIEFHDEAEWEARTRLFDCNYDLCELNGRKLDRKKDDRRLYHCLAIPSDRSLEGRKNSNRH